MGEDLFSLFSSDPLPFHLLRLRSSIILRAIFLSNDVNVTLRRFFSRVTIAFVLSSSRA